MIIVDQSESTDTSRILKPPPHRRIDLKCPSGAACVYQTSQQSVYIYENAARTTVISVLGAIINAYGHVDCWPAVKCCGIQTDDISQTVLSPVATINPAVRSYVVCMLLHRPLTLLYQRRNVVLRCCIDGTVRGNFITSVQ